MTAADDGGNRVSMVMYLDPMLAEALSLHAAKKSTDESNERSADTTGENVPNPEPLNLQLVMDVELNVTLRFGQRQLALREVLELTSGSVIELDRQVEEPVELLLEGKVIARGEAVVIDGNYGLRVTEVPQPISAPVLR
jgi:flagellar motor switch protein FliN/FliY